MKRIIIYSGLILLLNSSCHWASNKAKETVNKAGEVAGKAGSEFVSGVAKGVEKTFQEKVEVSDELRKQGLEAGKIIINSGDSATDNILTVYMIFNADLDRPVTLKVFNEEGQEYGRAKVVVKGSKGEARYVDFVFDRRTNVDGKGKLVFE